MMPTMPHMSGLLRPAALLFHLVAAPLAEFGSELGLHHLLAASDGERVGGHILRDRAPSADIGAGTDVHRRHQRDIGADEGAPTDLGAKLLEAVVIAGNRAGT